jgi:hypothetical protein
VNFSPDTSVAAIESEYGSIIGQYISYFNELPETGKKRFLERTILFRSIKHFSYIGMDEKKEIPILISAAAVQITFGLEKYELSIFQKHLRNARRLSANRRKRDLCRGTFRLREFSSHGNIFLQGYGNTGRQCKCCDS